jgi:hypothetical protein
VPSAEEEETIGKGRRRRMGYAVLSEVEMGLGFEWSMSLMKSRCARPAVRVSRLQLSLDWTGLDELIGAELSRR